MHFRATLTNSAKMFAAFVASDTNPDLGGGGAHHPSKRLDIIGKIHERAQPGVIRLKKATPVDPFVVGRTIVVRAFDD